jgi:hypothetical protein
VWSLGIEQLAEEALIKLFRNEDSNEFIMPKFSPFPYLPLRLGLAAGEEERKARSGKIRQLPNQSQGRHVP